MLRRARLGFLFLHQESDNWLFRVIPPPPQALLGKWVLFGVKLRLDSVDIIGGDEEVPVWFTVQILGTSQYRVLDAV